MSKLASGHEDDELDEQAQALLDALREAEDIPAEVHERVWARVDGTLAQRRTRATGAWIAGGLAVAAALVLLWIRGQVANPEEAGARAVMEAPLQASDRDGEQQAVARPDPAASRIGPPARPADDAAPVASEADVPERVPELDDGLERAPKTAQPRSTPPARTSPRPQRDEAPAEAGDSLSDEMDLLKRAKLALSRGEAKRAASLLDEHARRFPDGVLLQERQALRVVALCDAGELARGREEAKRFLSAHPKAALAERVRAACEQ
jgi:hypothetical protein